MTRKECKTIRQAIDESGPAHEVIGQVAEHLRGCAECRTFAAERRTLQGLIAGLGTVSAPSDFDFRLRARLAREKSGARNGGGLASFLKVPLPIAVVALVLLVAVGGVVIKNWLGSRATPILQAQDNSASAPNAVKAVEKNNSQATGGEEKSLTTGMTNKETVTIQTPAPRNRSLVVTRHQATATREMALVPAAVLESKQPETGGSVMRVPLDGQALKISIEDARGMSRTVYLPTVSFGSQRLVSSQSFMPTVSSSKGVW